VGWKLFVGSAAAGVSGSAAKYPRGRWFALVINYTFRAHMLL